MTTPDYTQQMQWLSQEPSLLRWQIKTIAHQWQKLGYACIVILALLFLAFVVMFFIDLEEKVLIMIPLLGMLVFAYFLFMEVRRKVWMVYNFTPTGGEIFYWRAYPEILFKLIPILVFAIVVVSLFTAAITGQWLIAVSGPIVIVFGLGSIAMSKNYQKIMTNFSHRAFDWPYIDEAEYDAKRNVIRLYFNAPLKECERQNLRNEGYTEERIDDIITDWDCYIFPTPELTAQVIELVEQSLKQGVNLERTKVELPEVV